MKWIFRFVVLVVVVYGGQTAFRQISLAHESDMSSASKYKRR
jgi:uncharacterized membrane protein